MKQLLRQAFLVGCCLALASLLLIPALASSRDENPNKLVDPQDVIYSGTDIWVTPADGMTFSDFSQQPIPAGFFCEGSAPFTAKVAFKGGGLNSVPAGILGEADTVIYRMDNAVFNGDGVAITDVKFLALSLLSIEPLQTECGQFHARIRLQGEQSVTSMRIERRGQDSGIYSAVLSVNAKVSFTPVVGQTAEPLELSQSVRFAPNHSVWARQPGANSPALQNYARIDVDGDGHAETTIPGPSNFKPGYVLQEGQLAWATLQQEFSDGFCPILIGAASATSTSLEAIARARCHCDPTVEWTSDPDCANWDTSQCSHMHCPGGPDPRL